MVLPTLKPDDWMYLLSVSIPLVGGIAASAVTFDAVENWYPKLKTPWFTPPKYMFGPIWTLLYLAMGNAFYYVLKNRDGSLLTTVAVILYVIQLLLNWAWSPMFFLAKRVDLAFYNIAILVAAVAACIFVFDIFSSFAAKLMVPYLVFTTVAMTVNYVVWQTNDPALFNISDSGKNKVQ
mmetsp:Transcript_427/g.1464  ORF Transcript_427/g.1464 Transcript_427/m.1464 type:complete len:179 (-) Transcript_427:263-799(-)